MIIDLWILFQSISGKSERVKGKAGDQERRPKGKRRGEGRLNGVKSEDRKIFVAIIRSFFDAQKGLLFRAR